MSDQDEYEVCRAQLEQPSAYRYLLSYVESGRHQLHDAIERRGLVVYLNRLERRKEFVDRDDLLNRPFDVTRVAGPE